MRFSVQLALDEWGDWQTLPAADPGPLLPPASASGTASPPVSSGGLPTLVGLPDGRVLLLVAGTYRWIPDPDTFDAIGLQWGDIQQLGGLPAPEGEAITSVHAPTPIPAPPAPPIVEQPLGSSSAPLPSPASYQGSYVNAFEAGTLIDLGYAPAEVLDWQRQVNESLAARGVAAPSAQADPGSGLPAGAVGFATGEREALFAVPPGFFGPTRPAGVAGSWRQLVDVFKLGVPAQRDRVGSIASSLVEVFR